MADFRTSRCAQFGHAEVVLHLSDASQMEPTWLIDYLEHAVASGTRFVPNQTVQIGWMVTKVMENPEGDLELWEPRLESIPIKWMRGVNNTVRHLVLQKSIAELLRVVPEYPSLLQAGTVTPAFWSGPNEFCMRRDKSIQNDSGWRLSALDDSTDGGLRSLFELACRRALIIPFLALPLGSTVICDAAGITVCLGDEVLSSAESELLRQIEGQWL